MQKVHLGKKDSSMVIKRTSELLVLTFTLIEISSTPSPMASLTMGVISPLSVATATQMSMLLNSRGPLPLHTAFT